MPPPGDPAVPAAGTRADLAVELVGEFLASVPLFSRCEAGTTARIAPGISAYDFVPGATIVSAGEQAKWVGVVFRGKASVRTVDVATGSATVVEMLRVGDHFGDVGALLGTAQPFAVVAEESLTVLVVPEAVVTDLVTRVAGFGHALARKLSTRLLQASVQTIRRGPATAPGASRPPESRRAPAAPAPDAIAFDAVDGAGTSEEAQVEDATPLATRLLSVAIERGASDIHLEPQGAGMKVRFRIAGALADGTDPVPAGLVRPLVARLLALAGVDGDDESAPREGRIGMRAGPRNFDVRVSVVPSGRGPSVAMHLSEADKLVRALDQIFLEPTTLGFVGKALERTTGAIVVAGLSNTDRTATLYGLVDALRRGRAPRVVMVEDPIEHRLTGVTQVEVQPARGLGLPAAMRAALRQDPDVLAVGALGDAETTLVALEAATADCLVLASLPARGAMDVLQRLEGFGCPRGLVAHALALVLVQQLVPRLCPSCVKVDPPSPVLYGALVARGLVEVSAPVPLPRPVGCDACHGTGYAGRVAIVEALQVGDELREAMHAGLPYPDLARRAREAGSFVTFQRAASNLMTRKLIAPGEALLVVPE